jgi:hypothetical protein
MGANELPESFPNCLMAPTHGCARMLKDCAGCGFDLREAERRKLLPFEQGPDGLWRRVIRREKK